MTEEKTVQERQDELKLNLAERMMALLPTIDPTGKSADELQQNFDVLNTQVEKILALLGTKTGRGPGRIPRATTHRSERFNTPELDRSIRRRKPQAVEPDEDEDE